MDGGDFAGETLQMPVYNRPDASCFLMDKEGFPHTRFNTEDVEEELPT